MTWNLKRQLIIFLILIAAFVLASFFLFDFKGQSSCFDGKKNGDETGVDCGGSCALVCSFDAKPLLVRFARPFKAAPGVYNAVALVENPNAREGIFKIQYEFRLYDNRDVLVIERRGKTFIPPNQKVIIFESNIATNERVPFRAAFRFLEDPQWIKIDPKFVNLGILINDERVTGTSFPKLSATLTNKSLYELTDVVASALLYDIENNVIAASQTVLPKVSRKETLPILFSWNEPFSREVSRIEIIPKVDIFNLNL